MLLLSRSMSCGSHPHRAIMNTNRRYGRNDFLQGFCRKDCDRKQFLETLLHWKGIEYRKIDQGGTHFLIPVHGKKPFLKDHYIKVLTAHYDRVDGTPGANDNSAAVFMLLQHIETLKSADYPHNTLILFTDQEELSGKSTMYDQGAYHLGKFWLENMGKNYFFAVLDMCGIGDTLIWGRSDQKINSENPGNELQSGLIQRIQSFYQSVEDLFFRYSRRTDMAIVDLFSDDLGFLLSGLPAIQLSVLPWKEALSWKKDSLERPLSWKINHTEEDTIETLQDDAFRLMEKFLRDLSRYQFPLS